MDSRERPEGAEDRATSQPPDHHYIYTHKSELSTDDKHHGRLQGQQQSRMVQTTFLFLVHLITIHRGTTLSFDKRGPDTSPEVYM